MHRENVIDTVKKKKAKQTSIDIAEGIIDDPEVERKQKNNT